MWVVVLMASAVSCSRASETPVATPTRALTTVTLLAATATATTAPPRATRVSQNDGPVDDFAATQAAAITLTPTVTPSPIATAVPVGVMTLLLYPPLLVNYDPSVWTDFSVYSEPSFENHLQAVAWPDCRIGVQGPTHFNGPNDYVEIELGEISYGRLTFPDEPAFAFYLAEEFSDEETGVPVLGVVSGEAEWEACQALAEMVLATLRRP